MSIGSELKSAREAAGLSLVEVAAKTKLRASVVAAIESNDFSQCGGDVYARGHIRVLASVYRIDSTYLVEIFDQHFGVAQTALDDLAQATSQNLDRRSSLTWKSLSGIAAAALLGAVLISNQISGDNDDGKEATNIASPIGNAGAVSVNVNGVEKGISGSIGEVVRLEFTPDAENSEG